MIGAIASHYVDAPSGPSVDWATHMLALAPSAWYRLGEAAGAGTMTDSSGNNRNLPISGTTVGRWGQPSLIAHSADTSADMTVNTASGFSLGQPTALTVFAVLRLDAAAATGVHRIWSRAGGYPIQVTVTGGCFVASVYSAEGGSFKTATSAPLPTDGATSVVVTARIQWGTGATGFVETYVNGAISGTRATGLTTASRSEVFATGAIPGWMDELAVWHNFALTAAQIADLASVARTGELA